MRLVVVAVCSLQLLFSGQTLLRSEAFTVPGIGSRSHQQPRSYCLRAASDGRSGGGGGSSSSSSSSSSSISTGGRSGNTATATGRAREIAAQARRRARDEGSRIRGAVQDPPVRGGGRATKGDETSAETGEGRTPSPLPRQQRRGRARLSQQGVNGSSEGRLNGRAQAEGSGAASPESATADATAAPTVIAAANVGTAAAAATAAASEEEVDALQRRVKEILEEYCTKAPPEERWPQGRKIRVRGVEIFYKDTGSRSLGGTRSTRKDRPTFVLLHGLAGSTASWDEVVGDLSEYGRVISFDRPGFGRTERVMPPTPAGLPTWRLCAKTMGENPYSADFAAKALFGVLDRLGVDKVIVVAHSLGAQVALRAARARPGMVRALVLTAPAILNPLDSKFVMGRDPNANLFSAILNLRTRVEMTAKLAAFNLQLLQPGEAPLHAVRNMTLNGDLEERVQQNFHDRSITLGRPELVAKYIEPLRDPLWDRGLLHFYKSLQGEVQPGEQLLQSTLDVWSGPSMIITGDDDPTVPTQSSIYVAESMESRLVVIESCAHIPMDEKSEVFTSSVLSFANSEEVEEAWRADGDSVKSWW